MGGTGWTFKSNKPLFLWKHYLFWNQLTVAMWGTAFSLVVLGLLHGLKLIVGGGDCCS